MKLYDVPNKTWVRVIDPDVAPPDAPEPEAGQRIFFDHIDGMYSYCKTEGGEVIHLAAWQEVEIDGAHDFHTTALAETAAAAYQSAVEQALYDHGHDPYNGTISTTTSFVLIPLEGKETVYEWAGRVIEDPQVQKWESCACTADPDHPIKNGISLWHFAGWAAS